MDSSKHLKAGTNAEHEGTVLALGLIVSYTALGHCSSGLYPLTPIYNQENGKCPTEVSRRLTQSNCESTSVLELLILEMKTMNQRKCWRPT